MCEGFTDMLRAKNDTDVKFGITILKALYFGGQLGIVEIQILTCVQKFLLGFCIRTNSISALEKFEEELYERLQ